MIEVKDLQLQLGQQKILDGVNLTIDKGEIVAIVGGSGSGKTTLLRCLLMLLKPSAGSIKIFDTDITQCSEEEALRVQYRWGVLFQHSALFSSLTVLDNVMFPLRTFTKLNEDLQQEIALLKIALAGLPLDAAKKYPAELSGGMKKRAALARAMVLDPELLFLDEPTSGLDPKSADGFDDLLLHLHQSLDLTVVMVTHDLVSLRRVANKVAFLGDGKVLAEEPLSVLMQSNQPMIKEYFSGPRSEEAVDKN